MNMAERHRRSRVLWRKHYANVPTREDLLDDAVIPLLNRNTALLDTGCGPDFPLLHRYASRAAFAAGVDLAVPTEPAPPGCAALRGDLLHLPFRDARFDLAVSRSVAEHLPDPVAAFSELRRVLKPGGRWVFTTPNRFYYSSIVARSIPFAWKDAYMRRVFGENHYDHFPVYYRANTKRSIRRAARAAGLRVVELRAVRHFPYYLLFSPALFRLGTLYDRLITRLSLDSLQSNWLVTLERP